MSNIGWSLLILLVGMPAAALWTFIVGFAGAPGALLAAGPEGNVSRARHRAGIVLSGLGQSYASMAFAAIVLSQARVLAAERDLWNWLILVVAAIVAASPAINAGKEAVRAAREGKASVQHHATNLTLWLVTVGIIALLIAPSVARPWAWIPGVITERAKPGTRAETRAFESDKLLLTKAFTAFNEASRIAQERPAPREELLRARISEGIEAASSVSGAYLAWLHPEFPRRFKEHFIEGQRRYLEGLERDRMTPQLEGIQLIERWHSEFWNEHGDAITDRAFGAD